jgi:riboflavin kinase/FMN adenylyltransferase
VHLAIGIFDGVHLGHRAVIESAVAAARAENGLGAVLTFWPHPTAVFRPESPTRLMLDRASKERVLLSLGVDLVITQPFTPDFAQLAAEDFLPWLKARLPSLAAVYVGGNFRFGQGRKGDVSLLAAQARQSRVKVFGASPVEVAGALVSSTRVRAQLEAGDIEAVNALLGYRYFSSGVVTPGKQLGRTIGFPTLNVPWTRDLRPRLGVYAVRVAGSNGGPGLPAVANFGLRPTVEHATEPRLEIHLLGACPFQTGDAIAVEWLKFLRPELKFGGVDELRAQISKDRDAAVQYFRSVG